MLKKYRPSVRSILFFIPTLLVLAIGFYQVRLSHTIRISPSADASGSSPSLKGPSQLNRGELEAEVTPGPPDYSISKFAIGDLVRPASLDGDLRNLPQVGPSQKRPMREIESPRKSVAAVAPGYVDPVVQAGQGALSMPAPVTSFKGLDLNTWGAGWPPDTNGDVGPNHYIQTVNTSIGIYNKSGTRLAAFTFDTFFAGTNTPCDASNQGDPVVVYDPQTDRWIITDFAWTDFVNGPYYECIAVSKTSDPVTGGWWMYGFRADDASHPWLNDYPKLGVWSDGIYMSANMFDILNSLGSASYHGVRVWALNRSDLISGAALRSVRFDLGTAYFSLIPSNYRGGQPPAGTPDFFASISSGTFQMWKFHVDWANPANSTFTGPTTIPVAGFTMPSSNIPQRGSSETLDTLGDRLMVQLQYRNISGTESLWANHTVVSGGVTGVRWYEIRNPNGSPTLFQQGTYQPDSSYRWMGSAAVDSQGNMAVGYSVSSSSLFPEIRYAGRLASDPLGQLSQGETTLIAGTGSQSGGFNRWGDYSALTVDPVDDCTFWYTTEYYETTGNNWQTRIGSFKYPSCGGNPVPTPTATLTPTPVSGTLHIGDLDGSVSGRNRWKATVTITVQDASNNPVSGATVSGSWSGGTSGSASCLTGSNGQCSVTSGSTRQASVTFTVTNVTKSGFIYDPTMNQDPDGDSNGTTIIVNRP